MNLIETGNFIKEQRKAQKLTQVQLAQKLSVSEKTISKWECGDGFPDTSLILPLCHALQISANELLSGKKLSKEEYQKNAEQNLLELKSQQERTTKFLLTLEMVVGYMSSICAMMFIFIASFCPLVTALRIVLICIAFIIFAVGIHFCLLIEKDAGYYECAHCHNKYIPTYKQVISSMHMGRTRYMKCPKCNKKSWQKKVVK